MWAWPNWLYTACAEQVRIDHVLGPHFAMPLLGPCPLTTFTSVGGPKFFIFFTPIPTQLGTWSHQGYLHNLVDKESAAGGWEQLKGDRKLCKLKAVNLLQAAEVRVTPNVPR